MAFETTRCVVLNSTYEPISITSSKRALILIAKGKAVVVEEYPDMEIKSATTTFSVPSVVALKTYVKGRRIFRTAASLTQKNLFARDNYTCQYCNRHKSQLRHNEFLTRDHVHPQDKGGQNTWENLVTACSTCNNKKANYFLAETGMKLLKAPTVPSLFELWMKNTSKKIAYLRKY